MCHDDAADIFNYCLNFYQKISKNTLTGMDLMFYKHFQEELVHLILGFIIKKIFQDL